MLDPFEVAERHRASAQHAPRLGGHADGGPRRRTRHRDRSNLAPTTWPRRSPRKRPQLANKDKEIAELKDKYLRALADAENIRRRMRQQSGTASGSSARSCCANCCRLPDNLERAVDAARGGGNGKPIVEGVEMVLRSLLDFLRANGVTPRESVGRPFDPQFHEAVDHVESHEHPPNAVISEFHRGYQVGERVLRPARVGGQGAAA